MTKPLSPAAQAIMVAATNGNFNVVNDPVYKQCIAAALRAAADQMSCYQSKKFLYSIADAMKLRAIAAELEALTE
jgi:hypothetical protein